MTLRDRIAAVISSTTRVEECADAILSDPEIAALREVAEAAPTYLRVAERVIHNPEKVRATVYDAARIELDAALARLEEARRD